MPDNYNIIADEKEMEWFFNHVLVTPRPEETYMVCLSARSKKLDESEREVYQLGRGEMMRTELIRRKGKNWNFNIYKQAPYKYNCDKRAMLTKTGLPYPEKCLVCYAYVNPSDELECVDDTIEFYNKINKELIQSFRKGSKDGVLDHLEKLPKIFEHLRSCHALHTSRRIWRDFDFDLNSEVKANLELREKLEVKIREYFNTQYGKGNVAMVKTTGGYHMLVRVAAFKSDPNKFIKFVEDDLDPIRVQYKYEKLFDEVKLTETGSQFLPLPGTLQYGNLVTIVNKDDFEYDKIDDVLTDRDR